jgi:enolase-phosphatase E1
VSPIEETGIAVVLLDIEGTTTPVDFVYRTLFGYARENLSTFLEKASEEQEIRRCVAGLKAQHAVDQQAGQNPPEWSTGQGSEIDSAVRYGLWLMERDSKVGPLKELQGLIWQEGYRSGRLRGEVFPDIPPALDRWRQQGKEISIYSSGSALAQQMLFRTTTYGDLSVGIRAFFDTRIGIKTRPESYSKIASISGHPRNQFLFCSDTIGELDAARSAGMHTVLVVRSAKADDRSAGHTAIRSFDELV